VSDSQPSDFQDSDRPESPYELGASQGGSESTIETDSTPAPIVVRERLSLGGILAWLTVAVMVVAMITLTALYRSGEETRTEATSSDLFPVQLQARTIVGQKVWTGMTPPTINQKQSDKDADKDSDSDSDSDSDRDGDTATAAGKKDDADKEDDSTLEKKDSKNSPASAGVPVPVEINDGTYEQRLCYVILVNENQGAVKASEALNELDKAAAEADFESSDDQIRLREIVGSLIERQVAGDFDSGFLSDDDRKFLVEKLGWVGELALVPEGTPLVDTRKSLLSDAGWSMGLMAASVLLMGVVLCVGVVLAIILAVMFGMRTLSPAFETHGRSLNIYIETFAIWIVVFFGGPTLTAMGLQALGIPIGAILNMVISLGFFFGSLLVLIYPVARGIKFAQVRKDIGWTWGNPVAEVGISPFAYVAGTPLMLAGLVCVLVLTVLSQMVTEAKPFGTSVAAGHPIQDIISSGAYLQVFYVVMMACVAAPIVEETMFRGVLYRHLRELSGSWPRLITVVFSAIFNGVIFAAIHPQGFVAIPLLTALAISFSFAREWRDSLVTPILMHAINNATVTLFMLVMMS
jgi:membrane protease YdiL (CAAX protease family)